MDSQRGRISSQGSRNASPQPSPHHYQNTFQGLDPGINSDTFSTNKFNTFQNPWGNQMQNTQPSQESHMYPHNHFNQAAFQDNQYNDPSLTQTLNPNDYFDNSGSLATDFTPDYSYLSQGYPSQQNNINPQELSKISSPDHASPGSGLLSPDTHNSPGQQNASPTSTNGHYQNQTPQHSRHASLDPASASYMGNTWQGAQFQQQHRRIPSDQYSDVSSVHGHSPYMGHTEVNEIEDPSRSPFLTPLNNETYGLESFNIGEQASSQPGSTYVSPRLMPQQGLDVDTQKHEMGSGELFPGQHSFPMGSIHNRNLSSVSDMGQADQFAPPTIQIDPAPVSRQQSFGPQGEMDSNNALSPPSNSSRGRNRSQSDTTGLTRPMNSRSVSPSVKRENSDSLSVRSPSPARSRESSPGVASGRISKENRDRRASTSSISGHSRDYILDLADPSRPNASSGGGGSSRVQKHPATFQCSLCPKKFTRAYNLRSHLRTHTDERPFVCTVCGKAFARQHDRKRHEGLHSGEKKFVCKGELNSRPGESWGCGRRFARADALGRHFRSEAGRVCIKPLLDEEAAERRNQAMREHQAQQQVAMAQQHQQYMAGGLQPVPPGMVIPMDPNVGGGASFSLPAALMAQYPQLANLDWNAIAASNLGDDGDLSDVGYDGYDDGGYDVGVVGGGMGVGVGVGVGGGGWVGQG